MVVFGQISVALGAVATMAMAPPPTGRMLVVPLRGGETVTGALRAGARLLAPGPLAGSAIVVGDRTAITRALPFPRAIVLAAPAALCGTTTGDAA